MIGLREAAIGWISRWRRLGSAFPLPEPSAMARFADAIDRPFSQSG